MAIRDNQLDDVIALVLETQTVINPRQKIVAWNQVRDQAEQQVMLAPYAIPPCPPVPRRARWRQLCTNLLRRFAVLLTDDSVYHRAAATRHFSGVTHTIGGEVIIHYYPLRSAYRHAI